MSSHPLLVALLVLASGTAGSGAAPSSDPTAPLRSPAAKEPATIEVPAVSGLHFESRDRFRWDDSAPSGTGYDVVTGFIQCMHEVGGVYCAACLVNDLVSPEYTDPSMPASGEGLHYLVRAQALVRFG